MTFIGFVLCPSWSAMYHLISDDGYVFYDFKKKNNKHKTEIQTDAMVLNLFLFGPMQPVHVRMSSLQPSPLFSFFPRLYDSEVVL